MSHSLNSLEGITYRGLCMTTIGVIKGDTRSLDYGSFLHLLKQPTLTFIQGGDGIWPLNPKS